MGRHTRFLVAFGLGLAVSIAVHFAHLSIEMQSLLGANVFFVVYLGLMLRFTIVTSADDLRRHSERSDEGLPLILALAGTAVAVSLTAIVLVLNGPGGGGFQGRLLALGSVPLGWAAIQTLVAFYYAHLFYRSDFGGAEGGLVFPGSKEPGTWDFLYFSFGVGMTAQVADVEVDTSAMRKVVLAHSVASYFYNTIILALAVNAAVTAAL
jgi:uncharacterized membrane protein